MQNQPQSRRAFLRAGTYELTARPEVPPEVVVDEYVQLAHAFLGKVEAGFVNDPTIGRYLVARAQFHQVVQDDLGQRHLDHLGVTHELEQRD